MINSVTRFIKDKFGKRARRFAWQRLTRGWDDSELWSMDHSLAVVILPRLKEFRKKHGGYPGSLETMEEWDAILDKMIAGFEWFASDARFDANPIGYEDAQIGLDLFAKWYGHLWD